MQRARVLVVDGEDSTLHLVEAALSPRFDVVTTRDPQRALALLASETFEVVVADVRVGGMDGVAELARAAKSRSAAEVVLTAADLGADEAAGAVKLGAFCCMPKPFDAECASIAVTRACEHKRLREQNARLRQELDEAHGFQGLLGTSAPMREAWRLVRQAAGLDVTVLLAGERGTGKERVARSLHAWSLRRERPFVWVSCGALPSDLAEAQLFGHVADAFPGAGGERAGAFEQAHGGTVFLDEVSELPLAVQVKLNRALDEKLIRRVGASAPVRVDVRVIAATVRDLKQESQSGRFREDLFYRLHVFPIRLPALRERKEDIPTLAAAFLARRAGAMGRELKGFDAEAMRVLSTYSWPGNMREMENAVERAAAVAAGPLVVAGDLPAELKGMPTGTLSHDQLARMPYREALDMTRDRVSREYLVAVMREFRGNVTRAAERAGMERESLHRLLKRYGVRSEDYKRNE